MEPTKHNAKEKKLLYGIAGLAGISLIILIHEMGHFLFAQLFGVPTPSFSLGFGPPLFAIPIGQTIFKVALLPFGGYVEMDQEALAKLSYLPKMLIVFAGIFFNLIFAYAILLYYAIRNKTTLISTITSTIKPHQTTDQETAQPENTIIGPVGIISMIGKSIAIDPHLYWFILAILSLNMGLFNIIPLPFFDGGKALIYSIEALTGTIIPPTILWLISTLFLAFFMLFIARVTMNDIKRLIGKK